MEFIIRSGSGFETSFDKTMECALTRDALHSAQAAVNEMAERHGKQFSCLVIGDGGVVIAKVVGDPHGPPARSLAALPASRKSPLA